jgi:hypothetical protein
MSREPRTERHLSLAWADQADRQRRSALWPSRATLDRITSAIDAEMRHEAAGLQDPGTESLLGQVLAAPTRHHTGHPAIPFPARPATARTAEPSESTRQRWARMGKLVDTAKAEGHAEGLRQGDAQGWRRGVLQGTAVGALLASLAWAVWLTVTAPEAAPPSASPTVPLTSRG